MRVLFVCSGNSKYHNKMPAFIDSQFKSLVSMGLEVEFYQIIGKGIFGYISNITPLKRFLKKGKYDIIHAHYGFSGIISYLAKRREELIVSIMGESEVSYYCESNENRIFALIMPILHKLFIKHFFSFTIFKSENICKYVKGVKNFEIIPNGVDTSIFKNINKKISREKLGLNLDSKIILWIGNTKREVKNYKLANDSFKIVKQYHHNIELLTVNNIPNSELPYYYSACDVFLLTSISEGSPNVIKEAMSCCTPIVSTKVGDVKWVIEGVKGCYLSESNKNDFSHKILKAIDFSEKYNRTEGLAKIISLGLSLEETANKISKIYNEILRNG